MLAEAQRLYCEVVSRACRILLALQTVRRICIILATEVIWLLKSVAVNGEG